MKDGGLCLSPSLVQGSTQPLRAQVPPALLPHPPRVWSSDHSWVLAAWAPDHGKEKASVRRADCLQVAVVEAAYISSLHILRRELVVWPHLAARTVGTVVCVWQPCVQVKLGSSAEGSGVWGGGSASAMKTSPLSWMSVPGQAREVLSVHYYHAGMWSFIHLITVIKRFGGFQEAQFTVSAGNLAGR